MDFRVKKNEGKLPRFMGFIFMFLVFATVLYLVINRIYDLKDFGIIDSLVTTAILNLVGFGLRKWI